jgi:hypothetical protein
VNDVLLRVNPGAGGWWVDCDLPLEPVYFRSGTRAEAVARTLALHLSGTGRDVRVVIQDRSEQVIATQRYFGA